MSINAHAQLATATSSTILERLGHLHSGMFTLHCPAASDMLGALISKGKHLKTGIVPRKNGNLTFLTSVLCAIYL